jgi:hypothetical protein
MMARKCGIPGSMESSTFGATGRCYVGRRAVSRSIGGLRFAGMLGSAPTRSCRHTCDVLDNCPRATSSSMTLCGFPGLKVASITTSITT